MEKKNFAKYRTLYYAIMRLAVSPSRFGDVSLSPMLGEH